MFFLIFGVIALIIVSAGLRNQSRQPIPPQGYASGSDADGMQRFPAADTLAVFEHPFNHYREAVPRRAWLWMLLFGLFYLVARQLWTQVALSVLVLVVTAAVAPWLLLLIGVPLWLFQVTNAAKLIIANYYRRGWKRLDYHDATFAPEDTHGERA